jgi:hypothetical protein
MGSEVINKHRVSKTDAGFPGHLGHFPISIGGFIMLSSQEDVELRVLLVLEFRVLLGGVVDAKLAVASKPTNWVVHGHVVAGVAMEAFPVLVTSTV